MDGVKEMTSEPKTKFRTVARCSNCGVLVNPKDEQCEHCEAWFIDDKFFETRPEPETSIIDTIKPRPAIPVSKQKRTDSCESWSRGIDSRDPMKSYSKVKSKKRRKTAKKVYSDEPYSSSTKSRFRTSMKSSSRRRTKK